MDRRNWYHNQGGTARQVGKNKPGNSAALYNRPNTE
jgi:hypothetical protein